MLAELQSFDLECELCGAQWLRLPVGLAEPGSPVELQLAVCRTCCGFMSVELTRSRDELMDHRKKLIRVRRLLEQGRLAGRDRISRRIQELNEQLAQLPPNSPERETIQSSLTRLLTKYAAAGDHVQYDEMDGRLETLLQSARSAPEKPGVPTCAQCWEPVHLLDAVQGLHLDCPSCGAIDRVLVRRSEEDDANGQSH
jgi:hypothetical protein